MIKVPLAGFWTNLGGTLKKEKEWEIPSLFKDFASECEAVRKGVGLLDLSHRGKIEVTGKDRITFLHNLLTNDIKNLGMGNGCYATLLNAQGRILGDMNVFVFANSVLLEMELGLEEKLVRHFEKLHVAEDVSFRMVTQDWIELSLQGPKSEALVGALIHGPVMVKEEFNHTNFQILDIPAALIRRSVTGEKGFHLLIPKTQGEPIAKRLLEVGKQYGLQPVGSGAAEILRIEAGIPRYGIDMDETVMLPETGLETLAASETKGCYPGQEVVAKIKTYGGLSRKLCVLIFQKGEIPALRDEIFTNEDSHVGHVTSACFSPTLSKGIALGYVSTRVLSEKTVFFIRSKHTKYPAQLYRFPSSPRSASSPPQSKD